MVLLKLDALFLSAVILLSTITQAREARVRSSWGLTSNRWITKRGEEPTSGNLYNGKVKWTDMTSGDGVKTGKDTDGIWYVHDGIDTYVKRFPDAEDRITIFFTGGLTPAQEDDIAVFNKDKLKNKGKLFFDIYSVKDLEENGLTQKKKDHKYFRYANRVSKGLALGSSGGTAYIWMDPENGRDIWSPASKKPQNHDPDHGGKATNGEIWVYSELPSLMRNSNINKIVSFYKTGSSGGKPTFEQITQWDVNSPGAKARDAIPDTAMDATPIILPKEADRPPLKRDDASLSRIY